MKKVLLITICILCVVGVVVTNFSFDKKAPTINVKQKPEISCSLSYDDLTKYAEASDDNLKSFFVEERTLSDIANNGYVTYVAIDEANNITKEKVGVDVDRELTTYHIILLQPLRAQIHDTFKTSEYLKLVNSCGWEINDTFNIEGVNYDLKGEYDVKVTAKNHSEVEPLVTTIEVDDLKAPTINLIQETIETSSGLYFSDEWFLRNVESVEDDNDDGEELKNRVTTNWEDVMFPKYGGYVESEGTYTITYKVTDSEGNTGTSTLRLTLRKQQVEYKENTEETNE